jgi:hypothetical protein
MDRVDRSSRKDLVNSKDGSVGLYFGPELPEGVSEKNWIKTKPGKGWFICFSMYGPEKPIIDGSYKLPGIVEVK